jgi:hypothetical protein
MISWSRSVRLTVWLLAAGGWMATQAAAQSVWLTGQAPPFGLSQYMSPPALIFDGQDRPQVVCAISSGYLQHTAGDAAGVIPNWSAWASTGLSGGGRPGQIYLARSGSQLYLGFRPRTSPAPTVMAAVLDGTGWHPYTLSIPLANRFYGLVIDSTGQPQWLINTETPTYEPPNSPICTPTWGYYVATQTGPTTATAVPVALGTGGGSAADKRAIFQGGQAILDRFGTLHTIQYYPRGSGTLLYAKGPLAGPFQVSDNLEAGWAVKLGRPSVTVDPAGLAHIVYTQDWPGYGLKHLTANGPGWISEWIEQGGSVLGTVGVFPKILVDRIGVLHVVYADALHGLLRHASKTQGQWQSETVDQIATQAQMGSWQAGLLAAAMDSQGGIGVVYWDASGNFKYAYRLPLDQTFVPPSSVPAVEVTNQ